MGLSPPPGLCAAALTAWEEAAAEYTHLSSVADAEILRAWSNTVSELRDGEAWVAENGSTFVLRDDKGQPRSTGEAPRYKQVRALRADLVKLAKRLAMADQAAKLRASRRR